MVQITQTVTAGSPQVIRVLHDGSGDSNLGVALDSILMPCAAPATGCSLGCDSGSGISLSKSSSLGSSQASATVITGSQNSSQDSSPHGK